MNPGTQEGTTRMAAGMIRRTLIATLLAVAIGSVWTQAAPAQVPAPPGGPVLVVTDPADQFGQYYGEILRAEGLNEFAIANVGTLDAQTLAAYQVVVLAETDLTGAQVSALTAWVNGGGNLIAMRPDASLAGLLGLGSDVGDLANGYLQVAPGRIAIRLPPAVTQAVNILTWAAVSGVDPSSTTSYWLKTLAVTVDRSAVANSFRPSVRRISAANGVN